MVRLLHASLTRLPAIERAFSVIRSNQQQSTMIKETYDLPSHWAVYLINGDATGFSLNDDGGDSEIALIDQFIEESELDGAVIDCTEESFFSKYHDVQPYGVKACDCLTFNFYK